MQADQHWDPEEFPPSEEKDSAEVGISTNKDKNEIAKWAQLFMVSHFLASYI